MDNIYKGFPKIAESMLPGTGGVIAKAYQKTVEGEKQVIIVLQSTSEEPIEIGPIPTFYFKTLDHLIQDIMFINGIPK